MAETIQPPVVPIQNTAESGAKIGLGEVIKNNSTKSAETFNLTVEAKMADTIDSSVLKIQKENLDPTIPIQEIAASDQENTAETPPLENHQPTAEDTIKPNIVIENQEYEALQRKINARTYIFKTNGIIDSQSGYLAEEKARDYDDFVKQHPVESKTIAVKDPEMQAAVNRAQQTEIQDASKTHSEEKNSVTEKEMLKRLDELAEENVQFKQQLEELRQQNNKLTESVTTQQELHEKLKPVVEELVNEELEDDKTTGAKPPETEEEKQKKRKQLLKTILMIIGGVGVVAAAGVVSSSKS